tara:strand:- start:332 stop:481 length:150 start_codon:yes stop_codon:yes gene_type:complete
VKRQFYVVAVATGFASDDIPIGRLGTFTQIAQSQTNNLVRRAESSDVAA